MSREEIVRSLEQTRDRTLWLLDQVPDEFLKRRIHAFYSPIGWHFGHIGATEEYWTVGQAIGQPVIDDRFTFLFTDRPDNPKENRINLPDREQIVSYLHQTRQRTLEALDGADLEPHQELLRDGYAWRFALQHECQHQETICEMLQLIVREPYVEVPFRLGDLQAEASTTRMICIPAGSFCMGTDDRFAYDNEKAAHAVFVQSYELAEQTVTAGQWVAFMLDGGYSREELWSPEGWAWREAERAVAPEYWVAEGMVAGPSGLRPIEIEEPVSSVSWYEAEAYARWAGKRLPTEEEWEYAASAAQMPTEGEIPFTQRFWGPGRTDTGANRFGVMGMAGGVWEWTSSAFLPYPGFKAFPYDGYSKAHMKGEHKVCRGGSWATSPLLLRRTFRNWYVPTYRQGFLGVRLANA